MNVSLSHIIFFIFIILVIESNSIQTGPGVSSCFYFGTIESFCNKSNVLVNELPQTCTSFFANSLFLDENFDVVTPLIENYDYGFLQALGKSDKKLYMHYSHITSEQVIAILDNNSLAMTEMNLINSIKPDVPGITGLFISDFEPMSEKFCGFTEKVVNYIDLLKKETKWELALYFEGFSLIDYYENQKFQWLNLTILSTIVDFYVISLVRFNGKCTADLRNTGPAPITGKGIYTLERLEKAIQTANIPKKKIYYLIGLRPVDPIPIKEYVCTDNYMSICTDKNGSKDWCADTQGTFNEKGKWVGKNGAGFVGHNVDFDDPRNDCHCGPFPSFNAILAGLKGSPSPTCPLFDRLP